MITRKKLFLSATFLIAVGTAAQAQVKEGRIVYQRKINMHKNLEDPSMKSMLPEFGYSKAELLFSQEESIWRSIKEEEDIRDQAGQQNGGTIVRMNFGGNDDVTYINYPGEKIILQCEMGPKKYLVQDSFPHYPWKLDTDTMTIKGHLCKKASTTATQGKGIVAWYAEDLQSPSGPETFGGLPGAILQLDINGGDLLYTAIEIEAKPVDRKLVQVPTNGKKITRADFNKLLQEQYGAGVGGGKSVIRIVTQ